MLTKSIYRWIPIVVAGGFFGNIQANTLYEVTLPCSTQQIGERQELFKKGMSEVLNRMSPEPEIYRYPAVEKALEEAIHYVERYAYEDGSLHIHFNGALLRPLIQRTGQAAWGEHRPNVIIWLAIESNQQRRLIGQETDPILYRKLLEIGKRLGIPFILPQMDIEDLNAVSINDVWGQYANVLKRASGRYEAQTILIGRLQETKEGEWQANWQWLSDDTTDQWKNKEKSLEGILNISFDRMQTRFKESFAPTKQGSEKTILIGIANVRSYQDFEKIETYLKGLDLIHCVSVAQIKGDRIIFEIVADDSPLLKKQLTLLGAYDPNFENVDFAYRWASLGNF